MISVIVPVYNVSNYLERCVQSLLDQSYADFELILVDDGSTDDSGQLCDQLAQQDQRIKVIHKPNGGLSDARNAGLEVASGQWLSFVDSDDWVEPDFLQKLHAAAVQSDAEVAICAYALTYDRQPCRSVLIGKASVVMVSERALEDILTYQRFGGVMTWNKLYKKDLFIKQQIRFPKGKVHEDNFTTYKTYYYANKVAYIDEALYNYYQRDNGIMAEQFSEKRYHAVEAAQEARQFVNDKTVKLAPAAEFNLLMSYVTLLHRLHQGRAVKQYQQMWRKTMRAIVAMRPAMLNNHYVRRKDRLRLWLASWPRVYYLLDLLRCKITN